MRFLYCKKQGLIFSEEPRPREMEHLSELATVAAESTLFAADKAAYQTASFVHDVHTALEPYGLWIMLATIALFVVGAIAMGTIVVIVILAVRGDIQLMRPREPTEDVIRETTEDKQD